MTDSTNETRSSLATRFQSKRKSYRPKLPVQREDALDWLRAETEAVAREAQLRIQDATDMATEFARGRISEQEYEKRWNTYGSRWGDPLHGLDGTKGQSDEEVLKRIDQEIHSGLNR